VEARELIDGTIPDKGRRTIGRIFESRDVEELKLLAHRLTDCDSTVALLATRDAETARLVFARSADLKADMNELMRRCCERLGGRGGGKPDFAQGGGPRVVELEAAIAAAVQEIS
jgi:alanyl-tRNA synthetase